MKERILVIDDDEKIRKVLNIHLLKAGFLPVVSSHAVQAYHELERQEFDCVICDYKMPDVKGDEVIKYIKEKQPLVPVIILTGFVELGIAVQVMKCGAFDYITKPVEKEHLIRCIQKAIQYKMLLKKNSQLEAENREYQRRLEAQVIEQTYQITSQSGFVNRLNSQNNLEEILTLVEEYTRQCIPCDHVAVLFREEEFSDRNGYFGIFTRPPRTFRISAEKKPIFPKLFSKKITLLNGDNPLERQVLSEILKEAEISTGLPFIVATLKRGAYPFGLILVGSNSISQSTLGDKDKEMFEFIADSASIAINNQLNRIKLEKGYFDTVKALALAVEAKDPYTRGHSDRVRLYATLIGKKLGLSEKDIKMLGFAGILHDIGKIGTPMEIINKDGPLTDEEWAKIKEHPVIGEKMIAHIDFLEPVRKIIRHHHERVDGGGYPDRIAGEQLCLGARILAVADTYDAMTSSRPYRNALSQSDALTELIRFAGIQFDRNCVKAFLEVHAEHLMEERKGEDPHQPQVMQI